MNYYVGAGKIARKSFREVPTKNGTSQVCQLTVPVNRWIPGKGGEPGTTESLWFEVTAWGSPTDKYNEAEKWNEKFDKGHFVIIRGELGMRTYDTKDGEHRVSLILDRPKVEFSPGSPREAATAEQTEAVTETEGNGFFS